MIEFIKSTHTYLVDGVVVPSVTQIMKQASDDTYCGIPEEVLIKAAERGTAVHEGICEYDTTKRISADCPIDYLDRYLNLKVKTQLEPMRQEFILCATVGITFAGTIDMLAKIGGKTALIDIKTSSAKHVDLWSIQLAGYDELLRENGVVVDEHYILHLTSKTAKLISIIPDYKKWNEYKSEQSLW